MADQAWPQARNSDEVQEALVTLACITRAYALRQDGWPEWLEQLAEAGRATRLRGVANIHGGIDCWVALERRDLLQAAYPEAQATPKLAIPASHRGYGQDAWTQDAALVELLRARLSGVGPQRLSAIAATLHLSGDATAIALGQLEAEGYVMRGRFTPGVAEQEWCERHLLARINRYTIKRLRREIEPVERQDFMRFLFDWQHLAPYTRMQGEDALPVILAQLEGYEAAAGAWEHELLALRLRDYSMLWLDALCRAGKLVWTRIGAPKSAAGGPVRATPIVLLPRRQVALWSGLATDDAPPQVSSRAGAVLEALTRHGAMFFDELQQEARRLPATQPASMDRKRRRGAGPTMEEAGRWALVRRASAQPTDFVKPGRKPRIAAGTLGTIALTLLRRYGVMLWRLLERDAAWLPTWRELLPAFHRLEARGDICGGRFIAGFSGEQFALPEAIALLREMRRRTPDNSLVCISGIDPLNLCGTLLPGPKVPALAGNRILFRAGAPVATMIAGKIAWLEDPGAAREAQHAALVGRH